MFGALFDALKYNFTSLVTCFFEILILMHRYKHTEAEISLHFCEFVQNKTWLINLRFMYKD